jgi:diadenosine tetraphosphate (Ap4A) HIT family hydrolase
VTDCPFCLRIATRDGVLAENELAVAIRDLYPVSEGHTLVVPRRHESDYFKLTEEEQIAILRLVREQERRLREELSPAAFNMGLNSGPAAGQTVPHAHIHLIPRYEGDVPDPRGGVRWVLASRAPYWDRGQGASSATDG